MLELLQFLAQRLHRGLQLLQTGLIATEALLHLLEPRGQLPLTGDLGTMGPLGCRQLSLHGGLAGALGAEFPLSRFKLAAQLSFTAAASHQCFAQLQQAAAQGLGLITIVGTAKTEAAAALLQAASGHGTAAFEQLTFEGDDAAAAQLPAG